VRAATRADLERIREIYNEGIEDREATLDTEPKSAAFIDAWFAEHGGRYEILVAEEAGRVVGWVSLNRYSHRCAYDGVADLSVYVDRACLLRAIENRARERGFHKIVLFTLPFNALGQALYGKLGYREVGVFKAHGKLDGRLVDVMAMEKILD